MPEYANHPTQKPVLMFDRMVLSSSNENNIILDPFLGSGTTAVAAKILGRKCVGIEISEKYCEIAAKRCSQSVMQLDIPKVEVKQAVLGE
jgi:DNA modification methylase